MFTSHCLILFDPGYWTSSRKRQFLLSDKNEIHLHHILESIEEITSYVQGMDPASYRQSRTTTLVVERLLQILTEAAFRLGDDAEVLCPDIDWHDVRGFGKFLRHAYDRLNSDLIWNTVVNKLPAMKSSVERALSNDGNTGQA